METTAQDPSDAESRPTRLRLFIGQLSWRMILMRLVINGLTLILVAALVPNIYFVDRTLLSVLLMALGLGILNALVKPIVQFLTLPFIFATFGFVVVLINTIMLLLLALIFDESFYVGGLLWAIIGGLVMGVVASFLESLLGLNLPIAPKSELPRGASMAGPGAGIVGDMLAGEAADDEEPSFDGDGSQPSRGDSSSEPGVDDTADADGVVSEPTVDEAQASIEAIVSSEAQNDADDQQQGTE